MRPIQLKMARAALDLSLDQLASRAGVSHVDVARVESGEDGDDGCGARLRTLLEGEGIEFIDEDAVRARPAPAAGIVPLENLSSANDE